MLRVWICLADHGVAVLYIDREGEVGFALVGEELFAQDIFDILLDGTLEWAGSILLVVSLLTQEILGCLGDIDLATEGGNA